MNKDAANKRVEELQIRYFRSPDRIGDDVNDSRVNFGAGPEDRRGQDAHDMGLTLTLNPHTQCAVVFGTRPSRNAIGQFLLNRDGHRYRAECRSTASSR